MSAHGAAPSVPVESRAATVRRPDVDAIRLARAGLWAGGLTLLGILFSGPIALALVEVLAPQPPWTDAATFASAYRGVQRLPYAFGVVLVSGCVAMVLVLSRASDRVHWLRADAARLLASVFAATILLNYVIQTTFVPALLRDEGSSALVGAFAMTNPASLGWSLEMWGYAFVAVALWLVAPALDRRSGIELATVWLIRANAVVSVVGGVVASARQQWVFSSPGLVGFGAWNVLMAVLAICFVGVWRARLPSSPWSGQR